MGAPLPVVVAARDLEPDARIPRGALSGGARSGALRAAGRAGGAWRGGRRRARPRPLPRGSYLTASRLRGARSEPAPGPLRAGRAGGRRGGGGRRRPCRASRRARAWTCWCRASRAPGSGRTVLALEGVELLASGPAGRRRRRGRGRRGHRAGHAARDGAPGRLPGGRGELRPRGPPAGAPAGRPLAGGRGGRGRRRPLSGLAGLRARPRRRPGARAARARPCPRKRPCSTTPGRHSRRTSRWAGSTAARDRAVEDQVALVGQVGLVVDHAQLGIRQQLGERGAGCRASRSAPPPPAAGCARRGAPPASASPRRPRSGGRPRSRSSRAGAPRRRP